MLNPNLFLAPEVSRMVRITSREREVLVRISKGASSPEIAEVLEVSIETIKSHRKSLLIKFKARNTAHLIRIAFETGILIPAQAK